MAQVLSFIDYQNLIWLSLIQTSNWVKEKTGQIREGCYLPRCPGMHFVFWTLVKPNNTLRTERWWFGFRKQQLSRSSYLLRGQLRFQCSREPSVNMREVQADRRHLLLPKSACSVTLTSPTHISSIFLRQSNSFGFTWSSCCNRSSCRLFRRIQQRCQKWIQLDVNLCGLIYVRTKCWRKLPPVPYLYDTVGEITQFIKHGKRFYIHLTMYSRKTASVV
jgi:hypothetical protein